MIKIKTVSQNQTKDGQKKDSNGNGDGEYER